MKILYREKLNDFRMQIDERKRYATESKERNIIGQIELDNNTLISKIFRLVFEENVHLVRKLKGTNREMERTK